MLYHGEWTFSLSGGPNALDAMRFSYHAVSIRLGSISVMVDVLVSLVVIYILTH